MREPRTLHIRGESASFNVLSTYQDTTHAILTFYRERRDGTWQEYKVELELGPEELACVGSTSVRAIQKMAYESSVRFLNAVARAKGDVT